MKKIKTFVLTVSEIFPSTHSRKGEETDFVEKIRDEKKIHTIRKNYKLWKERINQIQKGEAVLSIRVWTGKPYKSPQKEIIQLDSSSGIGVQLLFIDFSKSWFETTEANKQTDHYYSFDTLAYNDGLLIEDFEEWFKGIDKEEPLAIIHFTKFRY